MESHVPARFRSANRHHASVEVNHLSGCEIEYSFSGVRLRVPEERMTVLWGTVPHGVIDVLGRGRIVNIHVSLSQTDQVGTSGKVHPDCHQRQVLSVLRSSSTDQAMFARWARDHGNDHATWRVLLLVEIEMRFRRMALEEYRILLAGSQTAGKDTKSTAAMRYIDRMIRFIAVNYAGSITVSDVARHVGPSPDHSIALFRRAVGIPIEIHITQIRLSHARMLLANSDLKIPSIAMDSGFRSLSSFYEAVHSHAPMTPAAFRQKARLQSELPEPRCQELHEH